MNPNLEPSFHLLLEVPAAAEIRPSEEVSDKELISLIRPLYGQKKARQVALELANCDQHGFTEKKEKIRQSYLDRRGKLDVFMKELKQRFCLRCSPTLEFGYA